MILMAWVFLSENIISSLDVIYKKSVECWNYFKYSSTIIMKNETLHRIYLY